MEFLSSTQRCPPHQLLNQVCELESILRYLKGLPWRYVLVPVDIDRHISKFYKNKNSFAFISPSVRRLKGPDTGPLYDRAAGTVQTTYFVPSKGQLNRNRRDLLSVEVWHCLPLRSEREALIDDFPWAQKKTVRRDSKLNDVVGPGF